jgi:hypothetical protein
VNRETIRKWANIGCVVTGLTSLYILMFSLVYHAPYLWMRASFGGITILGLVQGWVNLIDDEGKIIRDKVS